MNRPSLRRIASVGVLLVGMATLAACEEDPVDTGHSEGDVASFRIREVGGAVLYEYPGAANADEDTLYLPDDGDTEIEIVWLAEDGDVVVPDESEHDWELAENHSGIVGFVPSTSHPWQGTFTTNDLAEGASVSGGFSVTLLHGGEEEFETPQLVAVVEG